MSGCELAEIEQAAGQKCQPIGHIGYYYPAEVWISEYGKLYAKYELSLIHISHVLAMADVQTGQVISSRCYLSWSLTDKERDAGDYSKRFAKEMCIRDRHGRTPVPTAADTWWIFWCWMAGMSG